MVGGIPTPDHHMTLVSIQDVLVLGKQSPFTYYLFNDTNIYMKEFEFIRKIAEGVPKTSEGLIKGIGDDAAVIEGPRGVNWLLTTDLFAEGVHFERGWADWETLGKKALLINISDIVAMGGIPWFYFVSIACPKDVSGQDLLSLDRGMKSVAGHYDMILAGGDTAVSSNGLSISLTVVGDADKDSVIYRSGARPGDGIFVSGKLGGSNAGLKALQEGNNKKRNSKFIKRHLLPEPRLKLASWLARNKNATSMIDISDGLIADLNHIADESNIGYMLSASKVPLFEGVNSFEEAITSGEEYELLFTMNKKQKENIFSQISKIDFGCKVTEVGEIVEIGRSVVDKNGNELKINNKGFVHILGE